MKKFSFFALAAASLVMASCSNDNEPNAVVADGTPVEVTFAAQLPADLGTRAYGDGTTAKKLQYAVYTKATGNFLFEGESTFPADALQTNVTIQLVTGEEYQVVFWAQNSSAPYTFNASAKTMTIDYANVDNNNEKLDAFYVNVPITVKATELSKTATLTRPFAQINIATGDKTFVEANGKYPKYSQVKLSNVPNTLNLLNGTVSGDGEIILNENDLPEGTITVGGKDYNYLSMSYVLAPKDGAVISTVQMNVDSYDDNFVYTNIPVKRNYKTNIVGDLLTSKTQWTVIIKPDWGTPDTDILVWDGAVETPVLDTATNTYTISSPAQLAGISAMVKANPATFNNKTVKLDCDIDLNNMPWTPIGNDGDSNRFNGVFDGQGHTISNVKVIVEPSYKAAGLFGCLNGTVKNLTIRNIEVSHISTYTTATDNGIASVAGSLYLYGTIENVHVINSKLEGNTYMGGISGYTYGNVIDCSVDGLELVCTPNWTGSTYKKGAKAGGLIGYFATNGQVLSVTGNTVNNAKVTAFREVGGLIGYFNTATGIVKNNKVTNCNLTIDQNTNWYESDSLDTVGAIFGYLGQTPAENENNTSSDITITKIPHTID